MPASRKVEEKTFSPLWQVPLAICSNPFSHTSNSELAGFQWFIAVSEGAEPTPALFGPARVASDCRKPWVRLIIKAQPFVNAGSTPCLVKSAKDPLADWRVDGTISQVLLRKLLKFSYVAS